MNDLSPVVERAPKKRAIGTPELRPIALIDCDGVLSDFIGAVLPIVYEVTGRYYEPHHVDRFDFCAALGLVGDEKRAVMHQISSRDGFCRGFDVLPGAVEGVARIAEIADVYVVTSPWNSNRTWMHDREAWLHEHFGIRSARVIHTSAKHLVRGDVLVDDKTSTVEVWRDAHPKGVAVRWSTLHNRNETWDGMRTDEWAFLYKLVRAQRDFLDVARIDAGLSELRDADAIETAPRARISLEELPAPTSSFDIDGEGVVTETTGKAT